MRWWRFVVNCILSPAGEGKVRSNPNLLDNWYWKQPVNSRGQTTYTNTSTLFIDRWVCEDATATIELTSEGIKFSRTTDGNGTIIQRHTQEKIESLLGRTVTLSALINGELRSITCTLPTNYEEYHSGSVTGTGWALSLKLYVNASSLQLVRVTMQPGMEFLITAFKLEIGKNQTLARWENNSWVLLDPPPR